MLAVVAGGSGRSLAGLSRNGNGSGSGNGNASSSSRRRRRRERERGRQAPLMLPQREAIVHSLVANERTPLMAGVAGGVGMGMGMVGESSAVAARGRGVAGTLV